MLITGFACTADFVAQAEPDARSSGQEATQEREAFHSQNRSGLSPNRGVQPLLSDGVGPLSAWRSVEL